MTNEQELRQTSDSFLKLLDRLNDLETEKRRIPVGSPEVARLAQDIEELSSRLLGLARNQTDYADRAEASNQTFPPINEVAPRELHVVLSEWRAAERALVELQPGTPDWEMARNNIEQLRDEYRRAHEARATRSSR